MQSQKRNVFDLDLIYFELDLIYFEFGVSKTIFFLSRNEVARSIMGTIFLVYTWFLRDYR